MQFVAMRELKNDPSRVLNRAARADLVITRNGKPTAALLRLDEDLLDDFVLAHHPTLLREVETARRDYRRAGGISHEEMKRRISRPRG